MIIFNFISNWIINNYNQIIYIINFTSFKFQFIMGNCNTKDEETDTTTLSKDNFKFNETIGKGGFGKVIYWKS